ncbi:MAG: hydrogenase maturation protease [Gemmataceae bacterium]|nr:hydrogenase maturation protease [Gemmataceae bacterium]MDW8265570.1 hydrogenase maturation protease [Gemmataceae bacterium]
MKRILVIGYGNPLRSDDGAGPVVAQAVASLPGVETVIVHQLLPELVDRLANATCVIFVDAAQAPPGAGVELALVRPVTDEALAVGHTFTPGQLLGLTQLVHGRTPEAWLVTVPGCCFAVGEGLSPTAAAGVRQACGLIERLAGGLSLVSCSPAERTSDAPRESAPDRPATG